MMECRNFLIFLLLTGATTSAFFAPTSPIRVALRECSNNRDSLRARHGRGFGILAESRRRGSLVTIVYNTAQDNEEEMSDRAAELGFDKPMTPRESDDDMTVNRTVEQNNKLRKSLDDSAKFKIRNDARFTWLAFFLVFAAYGYSCFVPEFGYLDLLGLPDGGIVGGVASAVLALASIVLFFSPELFGKKS